MIQDITLVCVSFNTQPVLELMLKSYVQHHYKGEPLKLLLWDNFSTDNTKVWLHEQGIPFFDNFENIGHENAVNIMYERVTTKYVLLSDSDVIYHSNCNFYLDYLHDGVVAAGDLINGDNLGSPIKPRLGAWSIWFDIDTCRANGITYFRNTTAWDYDVASQFYENIWQRNLAVHIIPRLPGNIDVDILGMKYGSHSHLSKMSWELHKHADREHEITMRKAYVLEQLKNYEDIDLKGKFI